MTVLVAFVCVVLALAAVARLLSLSEAMGELTWEREVRHRWKFFAGTAAAGVVCSFCVFLAMAGAIGPFSTLGSSLSAEAPIALLAGCSALLAVGTLVRLGSRRGGTEAPVSDARLWPFRATVVLFAGVVTAWLAATLS